MDDDHIKQENQVGTPEPQAEEMHVEVFSALAAGFILLTVGVFYKFGIFVGLIFVAAVGTMGWIGLFISNYRVARRMNETRGGALLGAFILTVFMWGG